MSYAFLVFPCPKCGEKIFAEHAQKGRKGTCPICGAPTIIGAVGHAPAKPDKRRARRVPLANARVTCESKTGDGKVISADDMPILEDLSLSGVGFSIKGEPDRKKLAGYGPPAWLKLGDTVTVTLHIPQLFRPRQVKAVVRRIVPLPLRKDTFRVGCEFHQAGEEIMKDLKKLLDSKA